MSNVYFKKVDSKTTSKDVNNITKELLNTLVAEEGILLEKEIPLKIHFGEPGNTTFIRPENYNGIIDLLEAKDINTSFIETGVLYGGKRTTQTNHLNTAKEHGFTRIPVIIADGETGEEYQEVDINKTHYKNCKLGKEFSKYAQVLVLSHFKGHLQAGFGGAIKNLGMGFASKGGKLAMHMGTHPKLVARKCKHCHLCEQSCSVDAITINDHPRIDHDKCTGCGACVYTCPHKAISIYTLKGIGQHVKMKEFREKLAEYAYAAQLGKKHIYINFAMNITSVCDCHGTKMKPIMDDIGIFASTDPVAIDKACYDKAKAAGKKFRGSEIFENAEKLGLGTTDYVLIEI